MSATQAEKDAELEALREWKRIILGTGTDQEAVIRMAAAEYTQKAVESWRAKVQELEDELAELQRRAEVAEWYESLVTRACIGTRQTPSLRAYIEQLEAALPKKDTAYNALMEQAVYFASELFDRVDEYDEFDRLIKSEDAVLDRVEMFLESSHVHAWRKER